MTGYMFGTLCYWDAEEQFGEIQPNGGHGKVVVFRREMRAAGIANPRIGDRLIFAIGEGERGTGAVDLHCDGWDPKERV